MGGEQLRGRILLQRCGVSQRRGDGQQKPPQAKDTCTLNCMAGNADGTALSCSPVSVDQKLG